MDILSDTLRVIRLTGSIFFTAELTAPWSVASPTREELAALMMPAAECVTHFHILTAGTCRVVMQDTEPFQLQAGQVLILPHGHRHVLCSHRGFTPTPLRALLSDVPETGIPHYQYGGGGSACHFICGYLRCDQRFNPLLGTLPPLLLVRQQGDRVIVGSPLAKEDAVDKAREATDADWLENMLRFATGEARGQRPGCAAMLPRLAEVLYLEALRCYMEQLPVQQTGWLAGVRDPEVGRALQLLHAHPERKWTVADLARAVGKSRSVLAGRFTDMIDQPPMHYLTGWRMQLSRHLLRQTRLSVPQVAERVGYGSETSFSRAFKRFFDEPPGAWRTRQARLC